MLTLHATDDSVIQQISLEENHSYSFRVNIVGQSTADPSVDRIAFTHAQVVAFRSGSGSCVLIGSPTLTVTSDGSDAALLTGTISVSGNSMVLTINRNAATLAYNFRFSALFTDIGA